MHLVNLSAEERKDYYKIITLDDFRKQIRSKDEQQTVLKSTKTGKDKITKQQINKYLESNYTNEADPFVKLYDELTGRKLQHYFKHFSDVLSVLKEKKYEELTEEEITHLKEYEEEYNQLKYPLSYENLLKACALPSEETINSVNKALTENALENANAEIARLTDENKNLKEEIEKSKKESGQNSKESSKISKENNKLKKDIKALQDEVMELKNVFSEDTIAVRLGTILGEEFARKRVSEIMEKLDDLEKKNNLAKNYSQNDLVLAAKYMINQLLKRG